MNYHTQHLSILLMVTGEVEDFNSAINLYIFPIYRRISKIKKNPSVVIFFLFKQLLLFVVCNALIHRSHISGMIECNSGQSEFYFF